MQINDSTIHLVIEIGRYDGFIKRLIYLEVVSNFHEHILITYSLLD